MIIDVPPGDIANGRAVHSEAGLDVVGAGSVTPFRRRVRSPDAEPDLEVLTWPGSGPAPCPPVILVHGAWHGAWCWDGGFGARLASRGPDVHALSLRGHGGSGGTLLVSRVRDYVSDLRRVVGALDRPPVLVGHSMGAFVVQKYLETDAAAGAVLLAPMPHSGMAACMRRLFRIDPVAILRMHALLGLGRPRLSPATASRFFFSKAVPEATVRRMQSRLRGESLLAYLDMLGLDLCRPRRGAVPTLVLGAGADAMFTGDEVEAVAAAHGAAAAFVPDMGHAMMLEPGWETVADRIAAWAARCGPALEAQDRGSRPERHPFDRGHRSAVAMATAQAGS